MQKTFSESHCNNRCYTEKTYQPDLEYKKPALSMVTRENLLTRRAKIFFYSIGFIIDSIKSISSFVNSYFL